MLALGCFALIGLLWGGFGSGLGSFWGGFGHVQVGLALCFVMVVECFGGLLGVVLGPFWYRWADIGIVLGLGSVLK